jgi:curved DNA-binding protein CbpA
MNDPYRVLGITPEATDEQVKQAYRALARKYHPDNYQDNPLADLAEEKMKEINEAYEAITKMRAGGGSSSGYQSSGGYQSRTAGGNSSYNGYQQQRGSTDPLYARVRSAINAGDLQQAESLLAQSPRQDAEWYFLQGSVSYRKGWLDEAMAHYQRAVSMDPGNVEYRRAYNMMQQGGQSYRSAGYSSGMDAMDCCTALMCMNCLCGGGHC